MKRTLPLLVLIALFCIRSVDASETQAGGIDHALASNMIASLVPIGSVLPFYGEAHNLPPHWQLCDGSALSADADPYLKLTLQRQNHVNAQGTTIVPDMSDRKPQALSARIDAVSADIATVSNRLDAVIQNLADNPAQSDSVWLGYTHKSNGSGGYTESPAGHWKKGDLVGNGGWHCEVYVPFETPFDEPPEVLLNVYLSEMAASQGLLREAYYASNITRDGFTLKVQVWHGEMRVLGMGINWIAVPSHSGGETVGPEPQEAPTEPAAAPGRYIMRIR